MIDTFRNKGEHATWCGIEQVWNRQNRGAFLLRDRKVGCSEDEYAIRPFGAYLFPSGKFVALTKEIGDAMCADGVKLDEAFYNYAPKA